MHTAIVNIYINIFVFTQDTMAYTRTHQLVMHSTTDQEVSGLKPTLA